MSCVENSQKCTRTMSMTYVRNVGSLLKSGTTSSGEQSHRRRRRHDEEDVVKKGYLKKKKLDKIIDLTRTKEKFFVLRRGGRQPGREQDLLEYYDSERKYGDGAAPRKQYALGRGCSLSRKSDPRCNGILFCFNGEVISLIAPSEAEREDWLLAFRSLEPSAGVPSSTPNFSHDHVWHIDVQEKSLGKGEMVGPHLACLTNNALSLIKIKNNYTTEFQLDVIRNVGVMNQFFIFELGRLAVTGSGKLYMKTEDSVIAENMHNIINKLLISRVASAQREKEDGMESSCRDLGKRTSSFCTVSDRAIREGGLLERRMRSGSLQACHMFPPNHQSYPLPFPFVSTSRAVRHSVTSVSLSTGQGLQDSGIGLDIPQMNPHAVENGVREDCGCLRIVVCSRLSHSPDPASIRPFRNLSEAQEMVVEDQDGGCSDEYVRMRSVGTSEEEKGEELRARASGSAEVPRPPTLPSSQEDEVPSLGGRSVGVYDSTSDDSYIPMFPPCPQLMSSGGANAAGSPSPLEPPSNLLPHLGADSAGRTEVLDHVAGASQPGEDCSLPRDSWRDGSPHELMKVSSGNSSACDDLSLCSSVHVGSVRTSSFSVSRESDSVPLKCHSSSSWSGTGTFLNRRSDSSENWMELDFSRNRGDSFSPLKKSSSIRSTIGARRFRHGSLFGAKFPKLDLRRDFGSAECTASSRDCVEGDFFPVDFRRSSKLSMDECAPDPPDEYIDMAASSSCMLSPKSHLNSLSSLSSLGSFSNYLDMSPSADQPQPSYTLMAPEENPSRRHGSLPPGEGAQAAPQLTLPLSGSLSRSSKRKSFRERTRSDLTALLQRLSPEDGGEPPKSRKALARATIAGFFSRRSSQSAALKSHGGLSGLKVGASRTKKSGLEATPDLAAQNLNESTTVLEDGRRRFSCQGESSRVPVETTACQLTVSLQQSPPCGLPGVAPYSDDDGSYLNMSALRMPLFGPRASAAAPVEYMNCNLGASWPVLPTSSESVVK